MDQTGLIEIEIEIPVRGMEIKKDKYEFCIRTNYFYEVTIEVLKR